MYSSFVSSSCPSLPRIPVPVRVLHKRAQHAAARLQQRVADDDLEEALQPLAAVLDDGVVELVEVDLARQRGDGHARRLALQDVAEVLKVRVAAAHGRGAQLERGDVGRQGDQVGRVAGRGR